MKLSGTGVLARAGQALTDVWSERIGNRFWDVLFDSFFYIFLYTAEFSISTISVLQAAPMYLTQLKLSLSTCFAWL